MSECKASGVDGTVGIDESEGPAGRVTAILGCGVERSQ